jgi:hypothetical protein
MTNQLNTALSIAEAEHRDAIASANNTNLQSLTSGKPLAVILSASGKDAITPGSTFTLSATVGNKGKQSALIEVYIEEISPGLLQWCSSAQEHLALGPDQTEEVVFQFTVPFDALPGTYSYIVVVDAHEHYPEDTPIRYQQYLHVLPGTGDIVRSTDPTFVLQPVTSSTNSVTIQPGGALPIQVFVHNRGDRVDRFRLVCSDLPKSWFSITYPQNFQGAGLVLQADSLNLNPGDSGQIMLMITPPLDALAGSYVPTVRLFSENNPDLVLLDLVYLQVPPNHLLQAELRTIISRVRHKAGLYQVRLTNAGNTQRQILLQAKNLDEEEICAYTLEHSQVLVQPKQTVAIDLQVQPAKGRRRPLMGGARILNFSVELQDNYEIPLTNDNLPGTLVWEARPWWQLLPFFVLAFLGMGAIAYLFWWLLLRIPPSPKIFQFSPEDSAYSAVNNDVVRLGFAINDAKRLQSITIVGMSADGTPLTRPEVYDFSQGLPAILQPSCIQQKGLLTCRQVRTSARKPGNYIFEMTALPKLGRGAVPDKMKTNPVAILPIPQPQIFAFASIQPIYQEVSSQNQELKVKGQKSKVKGEELEITTNNSVKQSDTEIRLNWAIANANQLKAIQVIGRTVDGLVVSPGKTYDFSRGIPPQLKKTCVSGEALVCVNVPSGTRKPGDYVFELRAISKSEAGEKLEPKKTEVIKILPKPPRILDFKINDKNPAPKVLIPIIPGKPVPPLVLSWQIDASEGTKVELLPAPGTVPLKGFVPFTPDPKPGSITLTLQITSTTGQQIVRSVILETYDPKAIDPAVAAAKAMADALAKSQQETQKAAQAEKEKEKEAAATAAKAAAAKAAAATNPAVPNAPGAAQQAQPDSSDSDEDTPDPKTPPSLSPADLPPQFDKRLR